MSIFSRGTLQAAFPKNPRIVAELEKLAQFLDGMGGQVGDLLSSTGATTQRLSDLEGAGIQPYSDLLQAISDTPDGNLGVVEKVGANDVILHEVDSADDSCLVPRYKLMSYVGLGPTTARPTLTAQRRAIYFDTTLAAAGKPVFWTGTGWVDATGAVV